MNFKRVLNEFVLAGDESPVLNGTTVLPDDFVDGGEEPKTMRGHVANQSGSSQNHALE